MRPRQLESTLQSACPVLDFSGRPRLDLEQYSTSPHLAAQVLCYVEEQFAAISGQVVADFGCGCGVLTVGCGVMEAESVFGFDMDERCIAITLQQSGNVPMPLLELVNMDLSSGLPNRTLFDTVLMNPPFGTRKPGVDLAFVDLALNTAEQVFSLHKSSTRRYIEKHCAEKSAEAEVLATLRYDLPKTHKIHTKKSVDIEVDLWHFTNI